ncbi:hypothetical protein DPMN_012479 [Dreissena polymorpha]|uniref:Secreted protein n=1 Tax=Dreissena polymorpha TaxID=45954 RepID=A0A9D4N721_DREPO|nr:hypothetical protein DPMN_012479 [Dreissena polymorpha]
MCAKQERSSHFRHTRPVKFMFLALLLTRTPRVHKDRTCPHSPSGGKLWHDTGHQNSRHHSPVVLDVVSCGRKVSLYMKRKVSRSLWLRRLMGIHEH